jgi:hypothetical protein
MVIALLTFIDLYRVGFDLGPDRVIKPYYYSMKYSSSAANCYPKYWALQASNYLEFSSAYEDPSKDKLWTTLVTHNNDTNLAKGDYVSVTFSIPEQESFFRVSNEDWRFLQSYDRSSIK